MFIIGDILLVVARIFHMLVGMYEWVVIASIIISWVRPSPSNDIVRTIMSVVHKLTEPVYFQIRKRLPQSWLSSGMDFTPIILIIGLYAADMLVTNVFTGIAIRLKMVGLPTGGDPMQGFPTF